MGENVWYTLGETHWYIMGRKLTTTPSNRRQYISVAFSRDGKTLAAADDDGVLYVWDTITWQLIHKLGHGTLFNGSRIYSPIWEIDFSANGNYLAASGGDDGLSTIWNTRNWHALAFARIKNSTSIAFSIDSKRIAIGKQNGPVEVWDIESGRKIPKQLINSDDSSVVTFSPDGRWLLCEGDEDFQFWDAKTLSLVKKISYIPWIRAARFAPSSTFLAVGDENGHMSIWDIRENKKSP